MEPSTDFTVIDDSGIYRGQQSYSRKVIGRTSDGKKISVVVHRDFYDHQSQFVAELWDGTKWNLVCHVPAESEQGKAMPPSRSWPKIDLPADPKPDVVAHRRANMQRVSDAVDSMVTRLLAQAYAVIY